MTSPLQTAAIHEWFWGGDVLIAVENGSGTATRTSPPRFVSLKLETEIFGGNCRTRNHWGFEEWPRDRFLFGS
jgi:hypothetical protein